MKNWTVKKRIVCGFATLLVLSGLLAISSILLLHKVETNIQAILVDSLPGVTAYGQIKHNTSEAHLGRLAPFHSQNRRRQEATAGDDNQQTIAAVNDKLMADYEKTITTPEATAKTSRKSKRPAPPTPKPVKKCLT